MHKGMGEMNLTVNILMNAYAMVILLVIYHHSRKQAERNSLQHKLFTMLLNTTALMLIADIIGRLDGTAHSYFSYLNHVGNFILFSMNTVLPSIWLLYVRYQLFREEKFPKLLVYLLVIINVFNFIIITLSQFYGWLYHIDSNNIYHRGPLYPLGGIISIAMILASWLMTITNRKKVFEQYFYSLAFFAAPPLIGILLQVLFYGAPFIVNSVVISLLIIFLNIQKQSIETDFLTGVNNRKKLETYLKGKIGECSNGKTFSAILLDLNNFKAINDQFGHNVGDDALETFTKLLRNCVRASDFIARYGGDEFYIILDISDKKVLQETVNRINRRIKEFNLKSDKPYKLSVSMGYDVYDPKSRMNMEQFQKHIDMLMYKDKAKLK